MDKIKAKIESYIEARNKVQEYDYASEIEETLQKTKETLLKNAEIDRQNKIAKIDICLNLLNELLSDYETEINPENPKEVSLDIIDDLKLFEITDVKEYTGELFAPSQPVMLDVQIDLNDEEN